MFQRRPKGVGELPVALAPELVGALVHDRGAGVAGLLPERVGVVGGDL
jgi:hypothetical protein